MWLKGELAPAGWDMPFRRRGPWEQTWKYEWNWAVSRLKWHFMGHGQSQMPGYLTLLGSTDPGPPRRWIRLGLAGPFWGISLWVRMGLKVSLASVE